MTERTPEQRLLLSQIRQIADGLAQTFAPFCEVVVHDLLDPAHALLALHNNLSSREVGNPATELGLARIMDPEFEQVIANYPNQFSDGRQVKSTSIGIKDLKGRYVAALCLNVDLTIFNGFQGMLTQFVQVKVNSIAEENLHPANSGAIREKIDQFAARLAKIPRALKPSDRRALLQELKAEGFMDLRRATDTVASHLGVSRTSVYGYAK